MAITAQQVKELRDATGAGPLDCKNALQQFEGDMTRAADFLREKGLAKAAKKAGRATNDGIIHVYLHHNNRLGVMIELNCETDFVAKTDIFRTLANDIALQIANLAPEYVRREDIPQSVVDAERDLQRRRALDEGKPEAVVDKIVDGRMAKFYEELALVEQPFIKDDSVTIGEMITRAIAELGENITLSRFARFEVGQSSAADEA
ncbi:MAG TPA: translation elongation factor Ts [Aggregatilinea sp.]|jgi:elongation factor Ts|uniref:translation elongation factor Ts n=1 Tax=Aggregatilinea sp. TaxID=2806333 RepID=UPI002C63BE6E|nr:translation elongation factor Ts [Aggregatilinea sp.]HML22754.1 translation elongation factor Ts [Aggregatilinea sp.]